MSEETDAPEGGAEGATAPEEQVVKLPEPTTEQPTSAEESGAADDAGEVAAEPPKKVPWFQKRIDEVTAQKYEAAAEAAYWRGIAQGQTPTQQPVARQQQVGPPQLEQFETYEAYERANIAFEAAKIVDERLAQVQQQQQHQATIRTYEEREATTRAARPDFDTVVRDPSLPITPLMAEMIRESDLGPEVAYHLGTNRNEAQRIASLPPHRQAAELGRIEAALTGAPQASHKPIPPAPPQTVSGVSSGLSRPLKEMSMADYVKARQAGQI